MTLTETAVRERVRERLRTWRASRGLTQRQAAAKLGIAHRQLQRWEALDSTPEWPRLERIARVLDLSLEELLDVTDRRNGKEHR